MHAHVAVRARDPRVRNLSAVHAPIVPGMTAKDLADQATTLAEKLRPGTWEAVQALALASIAQSLAAMSENSRQEEA